jgi:hypothetical protein
MNLLGRHSVDEGYDDVAKPYQFPIAFGSHVYNCWRGPVDLHGIQTDQTLQRAVTRGRIECRKANFNPLAIDIVVSVRGDKQKAIGGNHNVTTLIELGYDTWPDARFVPIEDDEMEARLYDDLLNCQRAKPAVSVSNRVKLGDTRTIRHLELLHRAGRSCSPNKKEWSCHNTLVPTLDIEASAGVGSEGLLRQLNFGTACWSGQKQVTTAKNLKAINLLFTRWRTRDGRIPESRLVEILQGTSLVDITITAGVNGLFDGTSENAASRGIAECMAKLYNVETSKSEHLYLIGKYARRF